MAAGEAFDLLAFRTRAQRYLRAKGWRGADAEDLLSEMVCYALARAAQTWFNLDVVYLRAGDAVDPRLRLQGARVRTSTRVQGAGALDMVGTGETPEALVATAHDRQVWLRGLSGDQAWLLVWYVLDGHTLKTIGAALGVTESCMSRRWKQLQRVLRSGVDD